MIIKGLRDEDFLQYKKPAMLIAFPSCTFKCEKECNCAGMCQNSELVKSPNIEISAEEIVARYQASPISQALVCGGLEPFDSFESLISLITRFRGSVSDDVIIYSEYYKQEIPENQLAAICKFKNIIIKWGRYIPGHKSHYDEVLGIYLASDNQYAEKIS